MIEDWRARFGVGDFRFGIVQLANFTPRGDRPAGSGRTELRESRFLTTKALPDVGIAPAIDIGDAKDIHPRNKQEVGLPAGPFRSDVPRD